eukprot:scaffold9078_cov129-Cylindrotheca_fusiformis.AAC.8
MLLFIQWEGHDLGMGYADMHQQIKKLRFLDNLARSIRIKRRKKSKMPYAHADAVMRHFKEEFVNWKDLLSYF